MGNKPHTGCFTRDVETTTIEDTLTKTQIELHDTRVLLEKHMQTHHKAMINMQHYSKQIAVLNKENQMLRSTLRTNHTKFKVFVRDSDQQQRFIDHFFYERRCLPVLDQTFEQRYIMNLLSVLHTYLQTSTLGSI